MEISRKSSWQRVCIADAHTCPNAKIHLERLPKRREATLAGAERLTERRRAK